jgi:hypothetical protein
MYGKREKLKRRAVRRHESRDGTNKILKQCLYSDNCQVSSFLLHIGAHADAKLKGTRESERRYRQLRNQRGEQPSRRGLGR